jgi:hypothetical protein
MSSASRAIERYFSQRYGREALYLPSGRLALYLAFREWLRPGDRLLMSPVNDDVVFFTVIAAGLIPVLGPVDPKTGNLDPQGVEPKVWDSLRGVLTTNLYGIPDRMDRLLEICTQRGILLIEDACQALDTTWSGRRIGGFSEVSAFSLTKHLAGVGGILAFTPSDRRASLERAAREEIRVPSFAQKLGRSARRSLREVAARTGTLGTLRASRRTLLPPAKERLGHRMPYRSEEIQKERRSGAGLDRFDPWVRVDNARYRTAVSGSEAKQTLREIEVFEENRRRRLEGARRLLELSLTPADITLPRDDALFKVPLFVRDRERVVSAFQEHGLDLDYIYDPPLDFYATDELAEKIPSPPEARRWSRDVLPVNPLQVDRFLELMKILPPLQPA